MLTCADSASPCKTILVPPSTGPVSGKICAALGVPSYRKATELSYMASAFMTETLTMPGANEPGAKHEI